MEESSPSVLTPAAVAAAPTLNPPAPGQTGPGRTPAGTADEAMPRADDQQPGPGSDVFAPDPDSGPAGAVGPTAEVGPRAAAGRDGEDDDDAFAPARPVAAASPAPAPGPDGGAEAGGVGSTRAAGVVGLAVMCSRLLGLARDQIFAGLFGAGAGMDAFLTAFRAPNLLRDLFAEGALSTAFVTTFSKKIATEGDAAAWRLANKVATLTVVFMSAVTLVGILFAPALVAVLGGGFNPEKAALTVTLTRVMYPFILLVSLAALAMGMLNAKHVFGVPAMASSFFNLGSIVGGVVLGWLCDRHFGPGALVGLAVGTLFGGLLQFAVQVPSLARAGYRYRPDFRWRDPGVATILKLMGPAVVAASAVQVNVLVNASFASYQGDGAVSWLSYAFRLMQLPLGVFGVAIATVTLPLVSRSAARGETTQFRATLARALRLAFFLTIPSAVGLICLAHPIISLIYERGRFSPESTFQTAAALRYYALGLVGYAGIKVLAPAFYALNPRPGAAGPAAGGAAPVRGAASWLAPLAAAAGSARHVPMLVSFAAIAVNLLLNAVLTHAWHWGYRGLALSTSLTAAINFGLLYVLMRRQVARLETRALVRTTGKLAAASALLAGVCWAGSKVLLDGFEQMLFAQKLVLLGFVIADAAAVFFGACYLLRVAEMREVVGLVARRFRRPPAGT